MAEICINNPLCLLEYDLYQLNNTTSLRLWESPARSKHCQAERNFGKEEVKLTKLIPV